jgi:hypothetical protein
MLQTQFYANLGIDTRTPGLEVRIHLTGKGRSRLSVDDSLDEILEEDQKRCRASKTTSVSSTWVYISGPNPFIAAGEEACKKRHENGVDWYGAKWDI